MFIGHSINGRWRNRKKRVPIIFPFFFPLAKRNRVKNDPSFNPFTGLRFLTSIKKKSECMEFGVREFWEKEKRCPTSPLNACLLKSVFFFKLFLTFLMNFMMLLFWYFRCDIPTPPVTLRGPPPPPLGDVRSPLRSESVGDGFRFRRFLCRYFE